MESLTGAQDVYLHAVSSARTKKLERLAKIRFLEADGTLSPQEAQAERDRAETAFTQAKKTAEAARDRSSNPVMQQSSDQCSEPLVQQSSERSSMYNSDDEVQIIDAPE